MKNKYLFSFAVLAMFVSASCRKNIDEATMASQQPTNPSAFAREAETDPEKIFYDNTLDALAWGLLDLSDNNAFKNVLNAEVAKQFDGDDNTLFVTLNDELAKQNIDLEDLMSASLEAHGKSELMQYLHNGFMVSLMAGILRSRKSIFRL